MAFGLLSRAAALCTNFYLAWLLPLFVGVAVGGGLGAWLSRRAHARTDRLLRAGLQRLAQGDLVPVMNAPKPGSAEAAVEDAAKAIADQVTRIRSNAALLLVDVEGMARLQRDVAGRTEQQAAALEQITATVEGLSGGVQAAVVSIQSSVDMARGAHGLAGHCNELSIGAKEAMRNIDAQSSEMSEVLDRIERIAKTTQMLSMNASVEASRAGEEGRGFQAIAIEIRSLSTQTSDALARIKNLVDSSRVASRTGSERINAVHGAVGQMTNSLQRLSADFESHSDLATEQSSSLREVAAAVAELDRITQANAVMVDSQASLAESLNTRAERLAELFTRWKGGAGAADEARALVLRAIAAIDELGLNASLRGITEGTVPCSDRDMYVFAYDQDARYLAFAGKPDRVGQKLPGVPGRELSEVVSEGVQQASRPGGGWLEYATPHPLTGEMTPKISYVRLAAGRIVVGCGIYKLL